MRAVVGLRKLQVRMRRWAVMRPMAAVSVLVPLALLVAGCTMEAGAGACSGKPVDGKVVLGPEGSSEVELLDVMPAADLSGRRMLAIEDIRDGDSCTEAQRIIARAGDAGYTSYRFGAQAFMDELNDDWEAAHDEGPRRHGPVAIALDGRAWLFSNGAVVA